MAYYPDFDPNALEKAGRRFGKDRRRRSCYMPFKPKGEGFVAETSCSDFFPGGSGPWAIELQPGRIALRSLTSNESMEFAKVGG